MIPSIILHEEYRDYLETNIQITGKNNQVFLLGNESVKNLEKYPNVEYVDISKYVKSKRIENLKGRRSYEQKKAAKLGFSSLYEYFEDKVLKKKLAEEFKTKELDETSKAEKVVRKKRKSCTCC